MCIFHDSSVRVKKALSLWFPPGWGLFVLVSQYNTSATEYVYYVEPIYFNLNAKYIICKELPYLN
jgi:hypothetical protein